MDGTDETLLEPYQYAPISSRVEIRCVTLEPGKSDEPLVCTLCTHQLDSEPHFEAVSYVWGKGPRSCQISCDGRQLLITPNLRSALRQCRLPDSKRVLWADSICIDQSGNSTEKGDQVSLMGRIFSQAARVLICFGDGDENGHAAQAASFLCEFNQLFVKTLGEISGGWDSFPYPKPDDPLLRDTRWKSVGLITRQPWFSRGWTVQEAALAEEGCVLWAGVEISWLALCRALSWENRRAPSSHRIAHGLSYPVLHMDLYEVRYEVENRALIPREFGIQFDLPMVLNCARELEVTDQRDRIFAFLGLPAAAGIRSKLRANYEKNHLEVYYDLSLLWVGNTRNLDLLHHVEASHSSLSPDSEYPSWVPQWNTCRFSCLIWRPWYNHILPANSAPESDYFGNVVGKALQTKGIIMDYVCFTTRHFTSESGIDDTAAAWKEIQEWEAGPSAYTSTWPVLAYYEALRGATVHSAVAPEQARARDSAYLRRLQGDGKHARHSDRLAAKTALSVGFADESSMVEDVHTHIQRMVHNRSIAVTRKGYYALVPSLARKGDVLCIIFGTYTPFVLRKMPHDNYYRLVGESCVISKKKPSDGDAPHRIGVDACAEKDWLDLDMEEEPIMIV